jgi:hypothetical protein
MPISTCSEKYQINNYENYEVDINGNIFSKRFNRYLKPYNNGYGYQMVRLINNNGQKPFKVHRLLALQFIPNIEKQDISSTVMLSAILSIMRLQNCAE